MSRFLKSPGTIAIQNVRLRCKPDGSLIDIDDLAVNVLPTCGYIELLCDADFLWLHAGASLPGKKRSALEMLEAAEEAEQELENACRNCGQRVRKTSNYCPECGMGLCG